MASKEPKGAYNTSPVFDGENYDSWKVCTSIHIQSVDMDVWDAVVNGRFQPQIAADDDNGVVLDKPKADWSDDDKKKVQYDLKAQNILISSLGVNEYHSVSHCKTSKDMWDALETLHKGTDEVKQSKINTLVQQYELFCMNDGETISSMQMRFTHIVNKLKNLGKTISNQDCTNKILRCMTKEWQPKVTAIKESQNLNALSMITLFGKLKEHEHDINHFKSSEDDSKKKERKSIALNTTSSVSTSSVQNNEESDGDGINVEEMSMFVRRYNRYIKRNGLKHNDKNLVNFRKASMKGRESDNDEKVVSCYGCGKVGHYKNECPELAKERGRSGANRNSRGRKAYIAWEEDEITSNTSDAENKDDDDLCFMSQTKKAKNEVIFSDSDSDSYSDFKPTYKDLQDSIEEMHDESLNAFDKLIAQKKTILKLEAKISKLK